MEIWNKIEATLRREYGIVLINKNYIVELIH